MSPSNATCNEDKKVNGASRSRHTKCGYIYKQNTKECTAHAWALITCRLCYIVHVSLCQLGNSK